MLTPGAGGQPHRSGGWSTHWVPPNCTGLGANPGMQLVWPPGFFRCHGELGEQHSLQQACRQERHELIFSLPTQRVQRELGGGAGRKN